MKIYREIQRMSGYIAARAWALLEADLYSLAVKLAGLDQANAIRAVDLSEYQQALCGDLSTAVSRASPLRAKAVYFEYDLDNGWDSAFFLCQEYGPEGTGNDDWACDWIEEITGPSLAEFGDLYSENGFDSTDAAIGATLYMIARTVASLGRCSEEVDLNGIMLCIGFHDQDPITRIREALAN